MIRTSKRLLGSALAVASVAASALAGESTPVQDLVAFHRSGQVFITWTEDASQANESYRVRRHDAPITDENLDEAQTLYRVWEGSSTFWADLYFTCLSSPGSTEAGLAFKPPLLCPDGVWAPRYAERLVVDPWTPARPFTNALPAGTGVLVWTLDAYDMTAPSGADYYYAVTTVSESGDEDRTLGPENMTVSVPAFGAGPEAVQPPAPIKIAESTGDALQHEPPLESLFPVKRHVYVQYMDLRHWNPTLSAPNLVENDYGLDLASLPATHALRHQVQYAYTYVVIAPADLDAYDPDLSGILDGSGNPIVTHRVEYPASGLPVVVRLHPGGVEYKGREYFEDTTRTPNDVDYYVPPAIEIRPIDVGSTGWFGYARAGYTGNKTLFPGMDYRHPAFDDPCDGIRAIGLGLTVANYTEQRVLRMVADLTRAAQDPLSPWFGRVDAERVFASGHSAGGYGALALALRYPGAFTAGYAHAPVTNPTRLVTNLTTSPLGDNELQLCEIFHSLTRKWGPPPEASSYNAICALELPCTPSGYLPPDVRVVIDAPEGWADHLGEVAAGKTVWQWQNHQEQVPHYGETAPFGVRHSTADEFILWPSQGAPFYQRLNQSDRAWGALLDEGKLGHFEFAWFNGLPPTLGELGSTLNAAIPIFPLFPPQPFGGYGARKSESVPALRLRSSAGYPVPPDPAFWPFPPTGAEACYNAVPNAYALLPGDATHPEHPLYASTGPAIEWNASWNTAFGADLESAPVPSDRELIDEPDRWSVALRAVGLPGSSTEVRVDVTPRRMSGMPVRDANVYTVELVEGLTGPAPSAVTYLVEAEQDDVLTVADVPVTTAGTRITLTPKYGSYPYGPDPAPPAHTMTLEALAPPVMGGALPLEVSGLGNFPSVVTLALKPAEIVGIGAVFLIDITLWHWMMPPVLPNASGQAISTFQIPSSPSLIGSSLYFQAASVDLDVPPWFTIYSNGLQIKIGPAPR